MPKYLISKDIQFIPINESLSICQGKKEDNVWLEILTYENLIDNKSNKQSNNVVRMVAGASKTNAGWEPHSVPPPSSKRHYLNLSLTMEDLVKFQVAINEAWAQITAKNLAELVKNKVGTSPKGLTEASIVAYALQAGYNALVDSKSKKSENFKNWELKDVLAYVKKMSSKLPPRDELGFTAVLPDMQYANIEVKTDQQVLGKIKPISTKMTIKGELPYDKYFKDNPAHCGEGRIPRLNCYAFRGDKRSPQKLKDAGGFWPTKVRDDEKLEARVEQNAEEIKTLTAEIKKLKEALHNLTLKEAKPSNDKINPLKEEVKKKKQSLEELERAAKLLALKKSNALNLEAHVLNPKPDCSGFISTSASTTIAKLFADKDGWVYVMLIGGAFHVVADPTHPLAKERLNEQELAVAGGIDFDNVVAWRKVTGDFFDGAVYINLDKFEGEDQGVQWEVFAALSGKPPRAG